MNRIQTNAFALIRIAIEAPQDEWKKKTGTGPLGILVARLQELSDLSADEINVALTWLVSRGAIEVAEEKRPSDPLDYRWLKRITSQGKLLYEEHKESLDMRDESVANEGQPADSADPRKVFVVHGRNGLARDALFQFLRAIGLHPVEWSEAIEATGEASPYIGTVLEVAFSQAQAVVVLMTPDDEARLREKYRKLDDEQYEVTLTPQARPNVLFEAGMAMGRSAKRTVLVELGKLRPFSDIGGRHTVRLNNTTQSRQQLAQRLKTAGCPVNLSGTDWHTVGDFNAAVAESQNATQSTHSLAPEKKAGLQLDLDMYVRPATGTSHSYSVYNLFVTLTNSGTVRADDYWVEVVFPTAFLNTSGNNWLEVREARTDSHWLFRAPHETSKPKMIYPNSKLDPLMSFEIVVAPKTFADRAKQDKVRATVFADGMTLSSLEMSIADLVNK